jgi:transcriptional regulator with XRE-family HTH domain
MDKKYRYSEQSSRAERSLSRKGSGPTLNLGGIAGGSPVSAFGDKIRKLRKAKGYTLEKLAELTGSSKSYIWELENKNPPRPSAEKLAKIAAVLSVTTEFLLDDKDQVAVKDANDEAFYRMYRRMDQPTKERIRRMVEIWDEDR